MSLKLGIKSYIAKNETVKRDWYVVDATDVILGRLASEVATRLRGKHKPEFTPNVDTGDHIIIINAEKIRVTGDKLRQKIYYRHSNYPGGLKATALRKQLAEHPERALEMAIKGMLPKGPLGYAMYGKLRVYKGPAHEHAAQQPKTLTL